MITLPLPDPAPSLVCLISPHVGDGPPALPGLAYVLHSPLHSPLHPLLPPAVPASSIPPLPPSDLPRCAATTICGWQT